MAWMFSVIFNYGMMLTVHSIVGTSTGASTLLSTKKSTTSSYNYSIECEHDGEILIKGLQGISTINITNAPNSCTNSSGSMNSSSARITTNCINNNTINFIITSKQQISEFTITCKSQNINITSINIMHSNIHLNPAATVKIPIQISNVEMRFKAGFYHTYGNIRDLPDLSTVFLGDSFYMYLLYLGTEKYKVVPRSCKAYAGSFSTQPISPSEQVELWSSDSCVSQSATDYRLMENFKTLENDTRVVVAKLFGFKFSQSSELTFVCNVQICNPGDKSDDCNISQIGTKCNKPFKQTRRRKTNSTKDLELYGRIKVDQIVTPEPNNADHLTKQWLSLFLWQTLLMTFILRGQI